MAQLQQDPLDFEVLDALRRYCEEHEDFAAWAEALELHAQAAAASDGDPIARARLHLELGDLYRRQLGLPDRALEHYRAAIDLDVAQRAALSAARALHAEAGAWDQVAELWISEAESLAPGTKRAIALLELSAVYADRLDDTRRASIALREAVAAEADDLQVQHRLATLLLEVADREGDAEEAAAARGAAAEVLCQMARAVSDDYALAYLESALDAVPEHAPALEQLEQLAPRMGRTDTLAPRWLAGLRATREPTLARALRLKLAAAYLSVGQLNDAQICLAPLLAARDPEAMELGTALAERDEPRSRNTLPSGPRSPGAPQGEGLANELASLGDALHESGAGRPLVDLATLERQGSSAVPSRSEPLDSLEQLAGPSVELPEAPTGAGEPQQELEPRTEAISGDDDPWQEDTEVEPPAVAAPAPHPADAVVEEHSVVEETLPRAAPLTIAELNALGGEALQLGTTGGQPHDAEKTADDDTVAGELRRLRAELAKRLRFRDRRGAAEAAEGLLQRGAFDANAVEALEEHFRLSRDFKRLRDLSLRLGRADVLPRETRSTRLREAVMLSESKLGDQEGAAVALEELLAIEPADHDAFHKLKRLLTRAQHWDKLASLLERRADAENERPARAEILRELGAVERDHRSAPVQAIAAFAAARAFDPGHDEDDVALTELYLTTERYAEAAATLEGRLSRARPFESPALLAALAKLYEEQLHDPVRARGALESWRTIEPHKPEILEALIRVLEQQGDFPALVSALTDKLAVAPAAERAKLHARVAELALHELDDPDRAATAYSEAIQRAPQERALWHDAARAFERASRAPELDALLWNLAQSTRDRTLSAALLEHLAVARAERGDLTGAILAREAEFATTQERAVLEKLVALLRTAERASDLARRLDELARRSEPQDARPLRIERASVLAERLHDPEAAKLELERVLTELAPDDTTALRLLIDLCIATSDTARRAGAQERLMKLAPSREARIELAVELVDLYEHELDDPKGAIRALTAWTGLAPDNPQPALRLVPLLTRAGMKRELLATFDKLTTLAVADEEAAEFTLRAARVAIELEDVDGAWNRLLPRVVDADDQAAETLLRELARTAGRGEQLAAVFIGLAQHAASPDIERRRWVDTAHAYEQLVGAHDRALEAMLRALAKQLDSRELLAEVERLTERARAWPRLAQVYDSLVRRAATVEERKQLLMRHAQLLESRADDKAGAFQRAWLAFQLDPSSDGVYAETKRLALATGRRDELLLGHERRAQSKASATARIEALLDAAALADGELDDRPRALGYLARAVVVAGDRLPQLEAVEAGARAIDAKQTPVTGRGLLVELTGVYERLAQEGGLPPATMSLWLMRAARIHELTLADHEAAYRALARASAASPSDEALLDELERTAALAGAWDSLTAHLQRIADAAIDSRSSSIALSRLGLLCERKLSSPSRAADAYEQLVRLRPHDLDAARRLRACLRDAHRFEELLIAIDRELFMVAPGDSGRLELLKQAAEAWEYGIKNRYEALDAWRKVCAIASDDADALAALARLRARPRADDSLLLDGDLVVRPEDLQPSFEAEDEVGEHEVEQLEISPEDRAAPAEEPQRADTLGTLFTVADTASNDAADAPLAALAASSETRRMIDAPLGEATGTFDAAVTLPLPPRGGDDLRAAVSLDALTSLVEQDAGVPRPRASQPPPPPPARRPSSRPAPPPKHDD